MVGWPQQNPRLATGHATTLQAREGAVEVRPFPAEMGQRVSEAQGLSDEAVKGNPMTTVIPGVDESKSSPRTIKDLTEPKRLKY